MNSYWPIMKRLFTILLYGAFMAYVIYLYVSGVVIVKREFANLNDIIYIILLIFSVYKFVFYGIYPIVINFNKVSLFFLGIALLFVGHYVLLNDPSNSVFIGDIVKILAVIVIILSPTNVFHHELSDSEKKRGIEIIEV